MDAFFAAVEQRDFPELRGKPVLVGGGRGGTGSRGVVTTASYEARVYGCRSAMPMAQARRLCPHAIIQPVRMAAYAKASEAVMALLDQCSPSVQPVSIDEAFADVTGVRHLLGPGQAIARKLKLLVREKVNLPCTVGVSFNKFLAKLASDLGKPDGLMVISPEAAADTLEPLSVGVIFGIGPKAQADLARIGIRTIRDLRVADTGMLTRMMGPHALEWVDLAWGRDERVVHEPRAAKSIGKERTFSTDVRDDTILRAELMGQVEACARRLRESSLKCRCVTLKLRTPPFQTHSRSHTLDAPTDNTSDIWACALDIFKRFREIDRAPLRLIGVSLHDLDAPAQLDLFATKAPPSPTGTKLDRIADSVVAKFGARSIVRGGAMRKRSK